ncbi:hypothetical protein BST63_35445 [Bradyrhizobium canariense]|uniref:Uncharacterized protein n=1 Tax=Bradyrhizobium canariense TaxID=255045 RepID=A0ABX3WUH3_9BRAD|nr:hypothetical protein [Bradyrhizobium canariense]OSJ09383.1 hypothetical protein BSR47_31955 [Bradyrhizobium canariense]OSJ21029.1 hypothetical protein BST63_35445 [Bradyrhizobium canariense]
MSATCDSDRTRQPAAPAQLTAILIVCCALIVACANAAEAQCSAQDVLRNHLALKGDPPARGTRNSFSSAADVPLWKTIAVGTFRDLAALRSAMGALGCGVGSSAEEIIGRPGFSLSARKAEVELVVVSPAELGFEGETATLQNIYARAQSLGLRLAPAEVAPQLRLQYPDQPIGEFLIMAMEPIRTWAGEPVILTVANGGAGLILIGQDGQDGLDLPVTSRFVFVRPGTSVPPRAAAFAP